MTILVVEDDPQVLAVTGSLARELGHTVIEVGNAEDAMQALLARPVDALIADIGLPGMSGDVFAAHARGVRPTLGIVFATGVGLRTVPEDGTTTVFLRKPYDGNALERALAAVAPGRT